MSRRNLALLLSLAAIWGASFLFIKVCVRELDPVALVWLRLTIAALTLVPIALVLRGLRSFGSDLRRAVGPVVVIGLVNSVVPFWLISWAETRLDSGLTAILQAAAPLFTALLALWLVPSERVGGWRLTGLGVGFVGVALIVGGEPSGNALAGLAVVGAALCYAVAGLYGRRLRDVPPVVSSAGSMISSSLLTLPFAVSRLPAHVPSAKVLASLVTLASLGTGVAYLLFFALLAGAGASRTILVTYLVPAMALVYGAALLGEPVTAVALGGLLLVLAGVAVATGGARRPSSSLRR